MDQTEKHVADYLAHRGYTNIIYEPDGNVPPDFLVDGDTAVEVRRLNQNYIDETGPKGLEEKTIPLSHQIKKLLASFGPPVEEESWHVFFRVTRPTRPLKTLKKEIHDALVEFMETPLKQNRVLVESPGFMLKVIRSNKRPESMFYLGGFQDLDSSGLLISKMITNICHCAEEKSRKVTPFRSKYSQWWLALVDTIGYGLNDFEYELLLGRFCFEHGWDKIIIINPVDYEHWFEI